MGEEGLRLSSRVRTPKLVGQKFETETSKRPSHEEPAALVKIQSARHGQLACLQDSYTKGTKENACERQEVASVETLITRAGAHEELQQCKVVRSGEESGEKSSSEEAEKVMQSEVFGKGRRKRWVENTRSFQDGERERVQSDACKKSLGKEGESEKGETDGEMSPSEEAEKEMQGGGPVKSKRKRWAQRIFWDGNEQFLQRGDQDAGHGGAAQTESATQDPHHSRWHDMGAPTMKK